MKEGGRGREEEGGRKREGGRERDGGRERGREGGKEGGRERYKKRKELILHTVILSKASRIISSYSFTASVMNSITSREER